MELSNSFEVKAPIDEAWIIINDVERIAPCLPGAQLQEIEGDEYRGAVKVKVGPITAQYKGAATFVEQDKENYRVVLKGDGRDTRGAGNASALITATLVAVSDEVTRVDVNTDLKVTGKVAQFGRGVMADISGKLMGQFAENLEELLASDGEGESSAHDAAVSSTDESNASKTSPDEPSGIRKINMPEPEAVDLLDTAGAPLLKRIAPVAGVVILLLLLRRLFGRSG
ncbi:MAG: SRPBCC family protein [Acidimicrobiales bacterium]